MKMIAHRRRAGAVVALFIVLGYKSLKAQETGQVGLILGYPTALGMVFKPNERLAVQTDFSFSRTDTHQSVTPAINLGVTTWSVEIGGLVYLRNDGNLHTYVSPMYGYIGSSGSDLRKGHSFRGSFGAEYSLSRNFSAFGETGLNYVHRHAISGINEITSNSWNIVTAAGVILYFR